MRRLEIWRGAVLAAAVLATGGLLAGHHESGAARGNGSGLPPVANKPWQAECGACHLSYHPGLLPARSWQAVMAGLERHFGENAALDAPTRDAITGFLVANAADRNDSRRSAKIVASIAPGATPVRITETRYFQAKHDDIGAGIWKRPAIGGAANCAACHRAAEQGDFSERSVAIPRQTASAAGAPVKATK